MHGGKPVENPPRQIFSWSETSESRAKERGVHAPSCRASLDPFRPRRKISRPIRPYQHTVTTHRFEEIIGGRAYFIEVMPVSNRWRAQLVRMPGIPTAMMPFYGLTPVEAAQHLTDWLTLAHRRQAPSSA